MNVTKFEHACFTVEKDGASIVVDPGEFTTDLVPPEHIVAIIVTHKHSDHLSVECIEDLLKTNPQAVVVGPRDVTRQLGQFDTRTVTGGDSFALAGFDLDFYGENHAVIHPDIPVEQNVGVLIEDRLYYPGDSFTVPEKSVDTLALPISAPWMKLSEAIHFMHTVSPRLVFPTHDAILSHTGQVVGDRIMSSAAKSADMQYTRIDGETISIE